MFLPWKITEGLDTVRRLLLGEGEAWAWERRRSSGDTLTAQVGRIVEAENGQIPGSIGA